MNAGDLGKLMSDAALEAWNIKWKADARLQEMIRRCRGDAKSKTLLAESVFCIGWVAGYGAALLHRREDA